MAPAPQWLTNDFFKDIIKFAIDHEISISDDKIIDYISKKRNHQIKSKTWIVYVDVKITEEPELKKIMCKHMEKLLGVTDDEVKKLEEHNFEKLTDMVNLFYDGFKSPRLNPHHRIMFSIANEKTMHQKELDYARDRKELPTFVPDRRKDFDFNEPGAVLLLQFCQRFGCVYDYETYAVFDKYHKYEKHDYQLSRVTIIHVYTNPMTKQKIVKAISRNKTWGSEIVQSSEDNVKFSNRNSDNLLQRKLDVLKLACNQKSDETTTLTLNEIVQENTTDIQPQKKKPRLIECLKKNTIYSTSENIKGTGLIKDYVLDPERDVEFWLAKPGNTQLNQGEDGNYLYMSNNSTFVIRHFDDQQIPPEKLYHCDVKQSELERGSYVFDDCKYDDENYKRVKFYYRSKTLTPERLLLFTFVGLPPNDDYRNYTADHIISNEKCNNYIHIENGQVMLDHEKTNVRWASLVLQNNNKSRNKAPEEYREPEKKDYPLNLTETEEQQLRLHLPDTTWQKIKKLVPTYLQAVLKFLGKRQLSESEENNLLESLPSVLNFDDIPRDIWKDYIFEHVENLSLKEDREKIINYFQKKYTTFKCKMQVVYLKMKAYAANQPAATT